MLKVYVAGPAVFRQDAAEYFDKVRQLLTEHDLKAIIPLDNDPITDEEDDQAAEIYRANVKMIEECDVVLADITPFRGPHMDPGTAFELGYAAAKGKRIYAYTPHAYDFLSERFEEGLVDAEGMLVEQFSLTENLMIAVAAECVFPTLEETVKAIQANLNQGS